ncbi:MAG: phosphohistidine phosphatase [Gammaproteobacteria bacterium]|jgi:phosphohistidine phosphatase
MSYTLRFCARCFLALAKKLLFLEVPITSLSFSGKLIMHLELMILRHGHAMNNPPAWDDRGDFGRKLSDRGLQQCAAIGRWIKINNRQPDRIICSPAVRANATAIATCGAADIDQNDIVFDERIYETELDDLMDVIISTPDNINRLLLVGHNPGLEYLILALTNGVVPRSRTGELMSPANLACLKVNDSWSNLQAGCASCEQIIRPDDPA